MYYDTPQQGEWATTTNTHKSTKLGVLFFIIWKTGRAWWRDSLLSFVIGQWWPLHHRWCSSPPAGTHRWGQEQTFLVLRAPGCWVEDEEESERSQGDLGQGCCYGRVKGRTPTLVPGFCAPQPVDFYLLGSPVQLGEPQPCPSLP